MKASKLATWTIVLTLLATPSIFGCSPKKEPRQETPEISVGVKTPDWEVRGEKKGGNKTLEGKTKNGYGVKIEETEKGFGFEVQLPKGYPKPVESPKY